MFILYLVDLSKYNDIIAVTCDAATVCNSQGTCIAREDDSSTPACDCTEGFIGDDCSGKFYGQFLKRIEKLTSFFPPILLELFDTRISFNPSIMI